jgi:hypothetical protein
VTEVVVDGEVLVVDPHRPAVERDPIESLAITRDIAQLRLDV